MAGINSIQSHNQTNSKGKFYPTGKLTGVIAGVGLAFTVASGYSKNKNFKSQHKNIALATIIITALHALLPKYMYRKK